MSRRSILTGVVLLTMTGMSRAQRNYEGVHYGGGIHFNDGVYFNGQPGYTGFLPGTSGYVNSYSGSYGFYAPSYGAVPFVGPRPPVASGVESGGWNTLYPTTSPWSAFGFQGQVNAPPSMRAAASSKAEVTVTVPAGTTLLFNGTPTTSTGTTRTFSTPPLEPGNRYRYEVVARWKNGETNMEQSQKVEVTAGGKATVSFPLPAR